MKSNLATKEEGSSLIKADPNSPALKVTGRVTISIKAGTEFNGFTFAEDTFIPPPEGGWIVGADYEVSVSADGTPKLAFLDVLPIADNIIGGFHYAPGGNAEARKGGDEQPAINPYSVWDQNFRPACPDPRGMALVDGKFWADIYLLGQNHKYNGTSKYGEKIADGDCGLQGVTEAHVDDLDYATATAVMKHHGKSLPSVYEFFALALGVTEKTVADDEPETTKLDAPRTSKFGIIQATGNMWQWGHDGDPDEPRASVFGGSWLNDDYAGSRNAILDCWPGSSSVVVGARGRSDHLQLA